MAMVTSRAECFCPWLSNQPCEKHLRFKQEGKVIPRFLILVYGDRLAGYGPFETLYEARDHAQKYFQDYRWEIVPYTETVRAHECQ
jgi:hypothetical protein